MFEFGHGIRVDPALSVGRSGSYAHTVAVGVGDPEVPRSPRAVPKRFEDGVALRVLSPCKGRLRVIKSPRA